MKDKGTINMETRVSTVRITWKSEGYFTSCVKDQQGNVSAERGNVLQLSPEDSYLLDKSVACGLSGLSSRQASITRMGSFVVETENSRYYVSFDSENAFFRLRRISGEEGGMHIGEVKFPYYLDFAEDGKLHLYNPLGRQTYVTEKVRNIFSA